MGGFWRDGYVFEWAYALELFFRSEEGIKMKDEWGDFFVGTE